MENEKHDEVLDDLSLLADDCLSSLKQQEMNNRLHSNFLLKEAKKLQEKQQRERTFLLQKMNMRS